MSQVARGGGKPAWTRCRRVPAIGAALLALAGIARGAATPDLTPYLDAVIASDLASARACWRPQDLAASGRLDIHYVDQPLKIDGDSPLWSRLEDLRAGRVVATSEPPRPDGDATTCTLVLGDTRFDYHFVRAGDTWLLASPVLLACARAIPTSGRFVTVYAASTAPPYQVALLDSCVTAMADRLGIDDARLTELERAKFGYLLTTPEEVERLAGAPTVGVANLQTDVVVTSHPCHAHELAHLVVNAWLQHLPLYASPLLQEGVAVSLGGRWGRHPRVLDRLGRTTLTQGFVTLDELLPRANFFGLGADLTYAPAGVFASFVRDRFGAGGLRAAYLAVSGQAGVLTAWASDDVAQRLAAALGTTWGALDHDFAAFVAEPVDVAIRPGATTCDGEILRGERLQVTLDAGGCVCVRADAGEARGAILFGGASAFSGENALFAEHFPGRPYHGESHALVFTPQEAKLYDYRRQMLVALHAEGFWPSDTFAAGNGHELRVTVDQALVPPGRRTLVE